MNQKNGLSEIRKSSGSKKSNNYEKNKNCCILICGMLRCSFNDSLRRQQGQQEKEQQKESSETQAE